MVSQVNGVLLFSQNPVFTSFHLNELNCNNVWADHFPCRQTTFDGSPSCRRVKILMSLKHCLHYSFSRSRRASREVPGSCYDFLFQGHKLEVLVSEKKNIIIMKGIFFLCYPTCAKLAGHTARR